MQAGVGCQSRVGRATIYISATYPPKKNSEITVAYAGFTKFEEVQSVRMKARNVRLK